MKKISPQRSRVPREITRFKRPACFVFRPLGEKQNYPDFCDLGVSVVKYNKICFEGPGIVKIISGCI